MSTTSASMPFKNLTFINTPISEDEELSCYNCEEELINLFYVEEDEEESLAFCPKCVASIYNHHITYNLTNNTDITF